MATLEIKQGKLKNNIALRYLGLTSLFLVLTQLVFGLVQVRWSYNQKMSNFKQQVEDTAKFLSVVSQESARQLDESSLERLLKKTSINADLVYSIFVDAKGKPLSSFLNQDDPMIAKTIESYETIDILKLVKAIKENSQVREIRQPILADGQSIGEIRLGYSLEHFNQEILRTASKLLVASLAVSGLLISLIASLFNREIRTPMRRLAQQVQILAAGKPPLAQGFGDEFPALEAAVEQMAAKLQTLQELQQRIVIREETEQEIEDSNRAKNEFLAMIGHEIRTPLNAVTGMTGLLLDTKLTGQQREFANIIRSSGETLLTMINNILDFSKIEANKLELEEQPFELGQCIEEALRLFIPQASEKKLELAYLLEPQTPTAIIGDVTRVRQILANLLSNAVKFTERGEVVVYVNATAIPCPQERENCQESWYEIRFAVKDTGIGIPNDRIHRLFQSFSQVDASTTRKYGGTGLGLVISKHLSELMGGKMWVHSTDGKGSTFYFTILASAAPSLSPANSLDAERDLVGKRMLIIDDNVTNQKILTMQAQSWGMFTCAVESGAKALEWLKQGVTFDIAILDMNMPQQDGISLASEIRKQPQCRDLPLILLSSLAQPEIGKRAQNINLTAILTKPIQQAQLYSILIRIFVGRPIRVTNVPSASAERKLLAESLPLRILVAEDVVVNQEVIRLLLEKLGYWSDIVSNGREVLDALRRQSYDVILMDVRMPEMDGLTATRQIRKDWLPEKCPRIIAMTADAMQGDQEKCLEAGMDDYIAKPIRLDELRKALRQCLPLSEKSVIDTQALDSLEKMAGKRAPEVMANLIISYLEDSPLRLAAMTAAIAQEDAPGLRQAAHALRSASMNLGANHLASLCQTVETVARSGTILGIAETLAEIKAESEKVFQSLQRELNRFSPELSKNIKS